MLADNLLTQALEHLKKQREKIDEAIKPLERLLQDSEKPSEKTSETPKPEAERSVGLASTT